MNFHPTYKPNGIEHWDGGEQNPGPPGWYIGCANIPGHVWSTCEGSHIYFGRKQDAERAIKALKDAGIETDEDIQNLGDDEFRQLAVKYLAW